MEEIKGGRKEGKISRKEGRIPRKEGRASRKGIYIYTYIYIYIEDKAGERASLVAGECKIPVGTV